MRKVFKYRYLIVGFIFLYEALNIIFRWEETTRTMMFCGFMYACSSSMILHLEMKQANEMEAAE